MTEHRYPQDIDAERAVLSAMLLQSSALDEALTHLTAESWSLQQHQHVFEAILEIDLEGEEPDPVRVKQRLLARGRANAETSPFLLELMTSVPAIASVERQARHIAALAKQRQLLLALERLVATGIQSKEPEQWIDSVEGTVFALTQDTEKSETQLFHEQIHDAIKAISERAKPDGDKGFWETPWVSLNGRLYGWRPGRVYVIAGTPGLGKTSFTLQAAWKLAGTEDGDETLAAVFFSMEMPKEEVAERALSQRSLVPTKAIHLGRLDPQQWSEVTEAGMFLGPRPLIVDDTPELTLVEVRSRTRRAMAKLRRHHHDKKLKLGMIVCDYLQLMKGTGETRTLELEGITQGFKTLAKNLGCAVVVLSQLNRGQQKEKHRRPMLSDLRGSGSIEQDADVVVFLHSPTAQQSKDRDPETIAIVAKSRGGEPGDERLHFNGACQVFTDWDSGDADPDTYQPEYDRFEERYP